MKTERTGLPTPEDIEAMIRRKAAVSAMEECYAASAVKVFDALSAENERLKGALQEIINPMAAILRTVSESNGELVLDGMMAARLCDSVGHLQSIAKAALTPKETDRDA